MALRYDKLVPADTFIGRYLQHMSGIETAWAYDFFTALWLMSLALGRSTYIDRPRAPVYMNMFVILAAESGVTRKSTAVRIATKIAREFISQSSEHMSLIEAKCTPEKLEDTLHHDTIDHGYAHCAISISELVTFLGREKYNLAMPGLLTDLYDCPDLRSGGGTLVRGKQTIKNVYLSFLSASTPTWLVRAINPDVIEGGFTSRCIFVISEERKRRIAWPTKTAVDAVPRTTLPLQHSHLSDLQLLRSTAPTTIAISAGGLKVFKNWYDSRKEHRDPFRASFESREDAHVLRIAGFLCINDNTWEIQATHVKTAIKIVNEAKEAAAKLFEGSGALSKTIIGVDKLRERLITAGTDTVSQSRLSVYCKNYFKSAELSNVLEIMLELGMVQKFEGLTLGPGRPGTYWRATKSIVAKDAMATVLDAITE